MTADLDIGNGDRLYQEFARRLIEEIAEGKYPVGSRLPPERVLAQLFLTSRQSVRSATLVLELQGIVEVRRGSGAYVMRTPSEEGAS